MGACQDSESPEAEDGHSNSYFLFLPRTFSYLKIPINDLVSSILVLQKPYRSLRRSKVKDRVNALAQTLKLWNGGLFEDLLKEGSTIQEKFSRGRRISKKSD